ncbi:MAG TPA: FAD-dependent oxidoreductase [Acidimicrobiales bacterium]|nr:FAD-dependent oxidoreductase [Acidimicrobiales bacterium]
MPPADVAVIGGGIMGCSIALELAKSGRRVRVIDAGPAPGAGSTSSSSAIIRFHYSTREGVIASWESMHMWADWRSHLGIADDDRPLATFHRIGVLVIEAPGDDRRARVLALFDEIGVPYEEWDARAITARAPAIDARRYWPPKPVEDPTFWADSEVELDGYFTPDAGFVNDPQLAAQNLADAARQHGAEFSFNTRVTEIRSDGGSVTGVSLADGSTINAAVVVNAAGPFSSRVNAMAGVLGDFEGISTRPLRQEVHSLPSPPAFGMDEGFAVNDIDLGTYFRPHLGGTLLIGGTEPECDPLVWIDDPDQFDEYPTHESWTAQTTRAARRLPDLEVPSRPIGLGALYDVTPDWVPIYDRTSLGGYYVAIGTSGNQFKNAPLVGPIMRALVDAADAGQDHDAEPVVLACPHTGLELGLGHYSRHRQRAQTNQNVMG